MDCLIEGKSGAHGPGIPDPDAKNSHIRVADVSLALSEKRGEKVVLGAATNAVRGH